RGEKSLSAADVTVSFSECLCPGAFIGEDEHLSTPLGSPACGVDTGGPRGLRGGEMSLSASALLLGGEMSLSASAILLGGERSWSLPFLLLGGEMSLSVPVLLGGEMSLSVSGLLLGGERSLLPE